MKILTLAILNLFIIQAYANTQYCYFSEGGEYRYDQRISRHFSAKALPGINSLIITEDQLRSELNIQSLDDFSLNIYSRSRCEPVAQRAGYRCFLEHVTSSGSPLYFYLKEKELKVANSLFTPWYTYTQDTYTCRD